MSRSKIEYFSVRNIINVALQYLTKLKWNRRMNMGLFTVLPIIDCHVSDDDVVFVMVKGVVIMIYY